MKAFALLAPLAAILSISKLALGQLQHDSIDAPDQGPGLHDVHGRGSKPNFIVFLTDDQDQRYNSLDYMPLVNKYIRKEGTEFTNYYTTSAMCCPSRVSLWTGQFAHNTNITDESAPHGGYSKFTEQKLDDNWLPGWLEAAGYSNNYIGKFINGVTQSRKYAPKGFKNTHWEPLVSPGIYTFYDPIFATNDGPIERLTGKYQTDVISDKSIKLLDDLATNKTDPFLLVISPTAPHDEVWFDKGRTIFTPPVPAKRHEHLFKDARVPRSPNFNPDDQDKVSWIQTLPKLTQDEEAQLDEKFRNRLRSLQATDELVERVIQRLEDHGQLDNTYIIYTTDNGYHLGTHRMYAGKQTAYEEDVNIPFLIRGPGVAKGRQNDAVATHTHFAATVLRLAGLPTPDHLDAPSIPVLAQDDRNAASFQSETFAVEFWAGAFMENKTFRSTQNVYKSVRVFGNGNNFFYSVWCTGEHELYDLTKDPYQIHNAYAQTLVKKPYLIDRLDALLNVLRTCKGQTCRDPWSVLHPIEEPNGGNKGGPLKKVRSLKDALSKSYDDYYASLPRFAFKDCRNYYDASNELTVPKSPPREDL
ncbi:hypothetical protein DFQ26_000963 [Actinomortierella ambigua]|nr:hypothetical protein DFQ26_000963 [Actinomortierella ambigua]